MVGRSVSSSLTLSDHLCCLSYHDLSMTINNLQPKVNSEPINRRSVLRMGTALSAVGALGLPTVEFYEPEKDNNKSVSFLSDGLSLSPVEYIEILDGQISDSSAKDFYSAGGCVAELEARFAEALGKEQAVFLPTGTLANHLAIRVQAGRKTRVLVQGNSHIYCDSFDCVQTLSHLNLVPLGNEEATVPVEAFEVAYQQALDKPHPLEVGVISLECPVRRSHGAVFDFLEMGKIAAFAKQKNIKMHLDGARLWIASAYTGVSPKEYASLFDTVFVSLYKCFNAGAGAILAGPRSTIEQVARDRKVFGGGLYQAWPYAAVALHYFDGYAERFQKAVDVSKKLFDQLEKYDPFRVEPIPCGTNIARLHLKDVDAVHYRNALADRGILLPAPSTNFFGFQLTINESLNRRTSEELASTFVDALPR